MFAMFTAKGRRMRYSQRDTPFSKAYTRRQPTLNSPREELRDVAGCTLKDHEWKSWEYDSAAERC